MNAGILCKVFRDTINALEADSILKPDGTFVFPDTVLPEVHLVSQIEASLQANGVTLPEEVTKVTAIIPLVMMLAGIQ
jgi:hypothetical protein